ncbi:MAG: response regulator transcription factor [Pirellulales bacterium]|nr:response regulator transcription factor [Pirellulales bacterium]
MASALPPKTRVLIADDHAILRAGLRLLLAAQPDMEVVGEAATGDEAERLARELVPDVITLDVTMPGGSFEHILRRLHAAQPQARVVVLTMHDDSAYARRAMAAGAAAFVVKRADSAELLTAIREVRGGGSYVDHDLFIDDANTPFEGSTATGTSPAAKLSLREREVLTLLAQGHTNQEIAERVFLSVKTVETYRARIGEKLGIKTRAEMTRFAREHGLIKATDS